MSYSINWYVPDRILYVTVGRETPIRAWGSIQNDVIDALDRAATPIHVIIDTEPNLNIENIKEFKSLSGLKPIRSINLNRLVIIQDNIVVRFFATLAIQVFASMIAYDLAPDFERAIACLKNYDPTLETLSLPEKPPYALSR